jgi:hypothetical protein
MPRGDTPYVLKGAQEDLKRLFYSDPNRALAHVITIPPGYGVIKAGTVMGEITESTSRINQYIPYVPADTTGDITAALSDDEARGFAYMVADQAGTSKDIYVSMDDSYKFAVGDHVATIDSDGTDDDGGAITAIDRTSYSHMAVITVTNTIGEVTVAKGACVWIQTNTAAPYAKAVGILKGSVDTGVGEHAKGGQGVLVIRNAMLYKDSLYCYNDDALADMSWGAEEGIYLVI